MFNFLTQNRKGELVDLLDVIGVNLTRLQQAALAKHKAIGMIAKAIAQSEIVVTDGHQRVTDDVYYRLNVRPNDNQTGTDFWYRVVAKLLEDGDALIVRVPESGKYYLATSYTTDNYVMFGKTYRNVTITDGVDQMTFARTIYADDALHLKYSSDKIRLYTDNALRSLNEVLNAIATMEKVSRTPFFKYKVDATTTFATKDKNGKIQKLMLDDVVARLESQLKSKDLQVIKEPTGTSLEYLGISSTVTAAEINSIAAEIGHLAAQAYDIPENVFDGTISEKSDATNEFITYAVAPVAEVINDTLHAKLIGEDDFIRGERCFVWLAHFKHIDVIDAAANLDKLRGIGFTLDELFEMVGYPALNTEFSTQRALTLNYSPEGETADEADGPEGGDDRKDSSHTTAKQSKHKERRKRRAEILPAR